MVVTDTLEQVSNKDLSQAFNEGFSDYQIPVATTEEKLMKTLLRNGYRPDRSVGLFDGDLLVGFVLNGVRGNYCYDSGTAIIPSYRGNGYAHLLLDKTLELLVREEIHTWVLEVLADNTRAIKLYKRIGFTQQREFNCYHRETGAFKQEETGITLTRQQTLSIPLGECLPSWQNSIEAVQAGGIPTWDIITDQRTIGTLCFDPEAGAIAQIYIYVEERHKGFGKNTIIEAAKLCKAEFIRFDNIDARYLPLNRVLKSMGFLCYATQVEMTNTLRGKA